VVSNIKLCLDGASWCVIIASLIAWLPYWAAGFSIIWTAIQIYTWWKHRRIK